MPAYSRINLSKWHLLLVDDDQANLGVQTDILRHYRANVYAVSSGAEALALMPELPPLTAILLDLIMPEMNGWELLHYIRAISQYVNVPVIAITAQAMVGDKERVMAAGFNGYVSKPIQMATLPFEIAHYLRPR